MQNLDDVYDCYNGLRCPKENVPIGAAAMSMSPGTAIAMNDNAAATPYPSKIVVAGIPAAVAKVTVELGRTSCRGGGKRKHTVGGRILGGKPPCARRVGKAIAGNRPSAGDVKEPISLQRNVGCCQVKRKSANTPQLSQPGAKVPRRGHRHWSSNAYGREAS